MGRMPYNAARATPLCLASATASLQLQLVTSQRASRGAGQRASQRAPRCARHAPPPRPKRPGHRGRGSCAISSPTSGSRRSLQGAAGQDAAGAARGRSPPVPLPGGDPGTCPGGLQPAARCCRLQAAAWMESMHGIHAWNPCMDGAWMHGCSIRVLARRAPAGPAALAARTEKRRDGSPPQPRRLRLRSNAGNRVCKVSERRRWKPVLNNHYDTKENTKKSSNTLKPIWALHEQLFHLLQSRHAIVLLSPRTPGPGPTNPLQNPVERPVVVERLFGPLGIARRDQE